MTARKELESIVKAFTVGTLKLPENALRDEALLREDLGLDSIDMFDILAHVSERTGKSLVSEQFRSVRTVSDFMDTLDRLACERTGTGAA